MKLEGIMLSEISQKEKDKYCVVSYMESKKVILSLFCAASLFSIILYSASLIHSSASSFFVVITSSQFRISVKKVILLETEGRTVVVLGWGVGKRGDVSQRV